MKKFCFLFSLVALLAVGYAQDGVLGVGDPVTVSQTITLDADALMPVQAECKVVHIERRDDLCNQCNLFTEGLNDYISGITDGNYKQSITISDHQCKQCYADAKQTSSGSPDKFYWL